MASSGFQYWPGIEARRSSHWDFPVSFLTFWILFCFFVCFVLFISWNASLVPDKFWQLRVIWELPTQGSALSDFPNSQASIVLPVEILGCGPKGSLFFLVYFHNRIFLILQSFKSEDPIKRSRVPRGKMKCRYAWVHMCFIGEVYRWAGGGVFF